MKTIVCRSLFATLIIGFTLITGYESKAQLATATSLVSNHDIDHFIGSTEEYVQVANTISALSSELRDAFILNPNLKYTATYNEEELIGFIVTGVKDSKEADAISLVLMQLEVLGGIANAADEKYFPIEATSSRVSRREAKL